MSGIFSEYQICSILFQYFSFNLSPSPPFPFPFLFPFRPRFSDRFFFFFFFYYLAMNLFSHSRRSFCSSSLVISRSPFLVRLGKLQMLTFLFLNRVLLPHLLHPFRPRLEEKVKMKKILNGSCCLFLFLSLLLLFFFFLEALRGCYSCSFVLVFALKGKKGKRKKRD